MSDYAAAIESKLKPRWKTAFLCSLLAGLAAHGFKLLNTLPNHDALFSVWSDMNVIGSGRWFLSAACAPSSFFDLPWLTGLLALAYIGAAAAVITDIFEVNQRHQIILLSLILVSFPCITNTFFFEFTADGYMLSMLLAALSVRFSLIGDNKWGHILLSALLLCLACGIYQAYVSFALLLALAHLMWELLKGQRENREYLRWILNQLIIYAGGLLAYLIIWKGLMALQNAQAGSYLGIDSLAEQSFGPAMLLGAFKNTARSLAQFFLSRNVFRYGWTLYAVLNLLFLLLGAALTVYAAVKASLHKRPLQLLLFLLALAAAPVFACIWYFISGNLQYHLLMLQSLSIIYIFVLLLSQRLLSGRLRACCALFFALIGFKFCLQANQCYFEMDKCLQRTDTMAAEICARVHSLDEGQVEDFAIAGGGDMSLAALNEPRTGEIFVNAHQIRDVLIFNHAYGSAYLNQFSGLDYPPADGERLREIEEDERVKQMPCWPLKGSVQVIDGTAVIKLPLRSGADN